MILALLVAVYARADDSRQLATREARVVVDGTTFDEIAVDGETYFVKPPRPGSALVELLCRAPSHVAAVEFHAAQRAKSQIDGFRERCHPSDGSAAPERVTFEQTPSRPARADGAQKPAPKPLNAHDFPDDTDPHVLPGPVDASKEFPLYQ